MKKLFLAIVLIFTSLHGQEEYLLGEGYQVGDMPVYLGGYFSLDYRKKDEENRYRVDDIAFMSYGGNNTISYMLELEFKEFYVYTDTDDGYDTERDHRLYIERFYFDYNINDNYQIRIGKYNTPAGFWNLMPINVLRATTSSPVSTKVILPQYTTGIDASYTSFKNSEFRLDAIIQNNAPIDDDYNNYDIDKHFALGASYDKNDLTLKLNGGYFSKRDNYYTDVDDFAYALISSRYEQDDYQILAEVGTQRSKDGDHNYAGYLQGLYRLTQKHITIMRLESYKDDIENLHDDIAIVAYTYRPLYAVALKTEYQQHTQNGENQFLISFSVLF